MKLSVYLSDNIVDAVVGQVVNGRLQICDVYSCRLKDGVLLNDTVTDEEYLKQILNRLADRYPRYKNRVHLITGSRNVTKAIQIPSMRHRQILQIVRRELMDYCQTQEDMIYDYSFLSSGRKSKGYTILCGGMERRRVEIYQGLFSKCGMKVKTLGIALSSVVNLAAYLSVLREETYILAVLDGRNLMLTLYVDGFYTYTSRLRLLPEDREEETQQEITDAVNAIVKFYGMHGDQQVMKTLYYCSIDGACGDTFWEQIGKTTGLLVRMFPEEKDLWLETDRDFHLSDHIFAAGNLLGR